MMSSSAQSGRSVKSTNSPSLHSQMSHLMKSSLVQSSRENIDSVAVLCCPLREPLVESGRFLKIGNVVLVYVVVRSNSFLQVFPNNHARTLS